MNRFIAALLLVIVVSSTAISAAGHFVTYKCYKSQNYQTNCGFLGWGRCTKYRSVSKTCQRCAPGWKPPNVCTQDINECLSNNGGCAHICNNYNGGRSCSCRPGYRSSGTGCFDINECASNWGGCSHRLCTNTQGSFRCRCRGGYYLHPNGRSCLDVNECQNSNGNCQHKCVNNEASYKCQCNRGYLLNRDGRRCSDINECGRNNGGCHHLCHNSPGSYSCSCKSGFKLHSNRRTCIDINECSTNNNCAQNCINNVGSYSCTCRAGFLSRNGGRQCVNINECARGNGQCQHICTDTVGSFTCSCRTGYSLISRFACGDKNECKVLNGGCQHTCSNNVGSYACSCKSGYTQDTANKHLCNDIDECITNRGGCAHICTNHGGGFSCSCRSGYVLGKDRRSCGDNPECDNGNGGCAHICVEKSPGFECQCKAGFKLKPDKKGCEDIDECATSQHSCASLCVNDVGSHHCACFAGYKLAADKVSCEDVDECVVNTDGCSHTCTNNVGSFVCSCPLAYVLAADGRTCNPLSNLIKCTPQPDESCTCPPGYTLHSDNLHCIDPCFINPCLNGGKCSITSTGYDCDCTGTKFTGKDCQLGQVTFSSTDIKADVGDTSSAETIYADVKSELIFTINNADVDIVPNPVIIIHPTKSATFQLRSKKRGVHTVSLDKSGRDAGNFVINDQLHVTGSDIYSRTSPRRFSLPKGCFYYSILSCANLQILFSSTSPWYQLTTNANVAYTFGIVFLEANALSFPISVTGWEITKNPGTQQYAMGRVSSARQPSQGTQLTHVRDQGCLAIPVTARDVLDFINSQALYRTFLLNIYNKLPKFLRLVPNPTPVLTTHKFSVSLQTGVQVQQIPSCRGAPTFDARTYTVFRHNQGTRITIFGRNIDLPTTTGSEEYCVIVNLCNDFGTTIMVIFPPSSQAILNKIPAIKAFSDSMDLSFIPRGIGLSFKRQLNVHRTVSSLEFWNGDELFNYAVSETANIWLAIDFNKPINKNKDFDYSLTGKNDLFIRLPSMRKFLSGIFVDETAILTKHDLNVGGWIRFKVFGKSHTINMKNLALASAYSYFSVGGAARVWCGANGNPPGYFAKIGLDVATFRGIPVLQDFTVNVGVEAYAFISFDGIDNIPGISPTAVFKGILQELKTQAVKLFNYVIGQLTSVFGQVSLAVQKTLTKLKDALLKLKTTLEDIIINAITSLTFPKFSEIVDAVRAAFDDVTEIFLDLGDQVLMIFENALDNFIAYVKLQLKEFEKFLKKLVETLREQLMGYIKDKSFGLKLNLKIALLGIEFPEVRGEFVYSDKAIARCHTNAYVFKDLQGFKTFRVFGAVILEKEILGFLKMQKGYGLEFAFAKEHKNKWVAGFRAQLLFLGLRANADVYLTPQKLYTKIVAKIFGASVGTIEAEINWSGVGRRKRQTAMGKALSVKVKFLSSTDGFDGSLVSLILDVADILANSAAERLDEAKAQLVKIRGKVKNAQNWLGSKETDVDRANVAWDKAVEALDRVKDKLEAAKGPFKKAEDKLKAAQKNVDRLCRIRTCKIICIPGPRCKICKKGWIRYPCCKWDRCLIKVPNPLCVVANAACKILRLAAYGILELAKFAVRVPMLALDLAKAAVSGAQFVVDKSRIVLEGVKFLLTLAQKALDGIMLGIKLAERGLDLIKLALKAALAAFKFIVDFGLRSIVDVRNCGFEAEISSSSWFEFTVHCEVNMFRTGWKTIRFKINFKKLITSLLNAAKKIVSDAFKAIFGGRKRRGIDSEQSDDPPTGDATENLFEQLCQEYKILVDTFLRPVIKELFEVSNETVNTIDQGTNTSVPTGTTDPEGSGINITEALKEYNITREMIVEMLKQTDNDTVLQELRNLLKFIDQQNKEKIDQIKKFDILTPWKEGMENFTRESFAPYPDNCQSFSDCVIFSLDQLTVNYEALDPDISKSAKEHLVRLRGMYIYLLNASALNASELLVGSEIILAELNALQGDDIFCGDAPMIITGLGDVIVRTGSDHTFTCDAKGTEVLTYSWIKGNDEIDNATSRDYTIYKVTSLDDGAYTCVVSNHIGSANSTGQISVQDVPHITSNFPTEMVLVSGEEVDLTCSATGVPSPSITWTSSTPETIPSGPRLRIASVQTVDSGIYRCEAKNTHGKDTASLAIKVRDATVACPQSEVSVGFVITPSVQENMTALVSSDGGLVVDKFEQALTVILSNVSPAVRVINVTVGVSTVACTIRPQCPSSDVPSGQDGVQNLYQSRHDNIVAAIDALKDYNDPDKYLFEEAGDFFQINTAVVSADIVEAVCPPGTVEMTSQPLACVNDVVVRLVKPPIKLKLFKLTPLTIAWKPPKTGQSFITGYDVKLVDPKTGDTITDSVNNLRAEFMTVKLNRVYDFYVRTVTASETSDWAILKIKPFGGEDGRKPSCVRYVNELNCEHCAPGTYAANPGNCHMFYQCSNQFWYAFTCPSGLLFDESINQCNWPYFVGC